MAHIYTCIGILTHDLPRFTGARRGVFSIVQVGIRSPTRRFRTVKVQVFYARRPYRLFQCAADLVAMVSSPVTPR